jgi:ATP-dependent Lhr-like helicase
VSAAALAGSLDVAVARIDAALAVLQAEGFAMRGAFSADAAPASEWCERRLLARIHRYTVKRLRAEIEPIAARDFLRFLFDWQRVVPALRMEGPDAVGAILGQLEGYEAPASAWETEIPRRITEYEPAWLDGSARQSLHVDPTCAAARTRARAPQYAPRPSCCSRAATCACGHPSPVRWIGEPSGGARRAAEYLATHGALSSDEISAGTVSALAGRATRRTEPPGLITRTASPACARCWYPQTP